MDRDGPKLYESVSYTEMPHPCLRDPVPPAIFPSRKRTAIDKDSIFRLLEQAASSTEDPPPSLKEGGKLLGYQPTTLYTIIRGFLREVCRGVEAAYFTQEASDSYR
jgi:hypothetical protein